ncbi:hypothetical protein RR46_01761 [Papilio xuthus]|uniref:Uncharacterized protein n=1 Tax=Papilio xuthus TaxID=66420 RepID=A0A194QFY0_PAPXU|nr:hypothetical protein RR46_01761 [Papilio xuthus]
MELERSGRKENSSRTPRRRLQATLGYPVEHSLFINEGTIIETVPLPGSGIGTGFPFAQRALGSTDSRATTVHAKPFSTSVLQGLAGVFATTTKICTDGGSRRALAQTLLRSPPRTSYSLRHNDDYI